MKKYLILGFVGLMGGLVALGGASLILHQNVLSAGAAQIESAPNIHFANYTPGAASTVADFTIAADKTLPVLVNIQAALRRHGGHTMPSDLENIPEN